MYKVNATRDSWRESLRKALSSMSLGRSSSNTSTHRSKTSTRSGASSRRSTRNLKSQGLDLGERTLFVLNETLNRLSNSWVTPIVLLIVIIVYALLGGLIFKLIEGNDDDVSKKNVFEKRETTATDIEEVCKKYDSLNGEKKDNHFNEVTKILQDYETSIRDNINYNAKMDRGKEELNWAFWDSVFFCCTVFTTIGYGHIAPVTVAGRIGVIVYAILGIPLFLIVLTDFGHLLTRGLKTVYACCRKIYYSAPCQIGKGELQNRVKTMRQGERTGNFREIEIEEDPEEYKVDDQFDVPISVAFAILFIYLIIGSVCFSLWEQFSFLESFYFVFISMATIGFGDFVPQNPSKMMVTIIFLFVGLSIAAMCIAVVRAQMIKTFVDATSKFGEAYGLDIEVDPRQLEEERKSRGQ